MHNADEQQLSPPPAEPARASKPCVLITGASSGIGEAAVRAFGRAGYTVVLAARRYDRLQQIAAELKNERGVRALPVETDVTDPAAVDACVQATLDHFGSIDVLVNSAGIGHLDWIENLSLASGVQKQLETNLLGAIYMTRAVTPGMQRVRRGHVIQVNSLAGFIAPPMYSVYAATKFGLRGFTDSLRRELLPWGIAVSGIYPATVATRFAFGTVAGRRTGMTTPSRLVLSPEDVAARIVGVVRRPRRSVYMPAWSRVIVWLAALSPAMVDWAMARWFVFPERKLELRESPRPPAAE